MGQHHFLEKQVGPRTDYLRVHLNLPGLTQVTVQLAELAKALGPRRTAQAVCGGGCTSVEAHSPETDGAEGGTHSLVGSQTRSAERGAAG